MTEERKLENRSEKSASTENLILFDWLTFTSKTRGVGDMMELLGMASPSIVWQERDAYMNGYPHRVTFDGVNILYGGREDMGVCVTMSGQGCRTYETHGANNWLDLFRVLLDGVAGDDINITRLDVAFDDHTGLLDIQRLLDDTDDHHYVSRSRWWKVEYGSEGTSIYHGSPRSNIRIRIYDKAAERGFLDDTHWIRVELQLRDENSQSFIEKVHAGEQVGIVFRGVLANYLTYREPSDDSNRSRWPLVDYWERLLDGVAAIRLWSDPGTEYNIFRLTRWLVDQCGGAISCYRDIMGLDDLDEQIKLKHKRLSPKYEKIKAECELLKKELLEG